MQANTQQPIRVLLVDDHAVVRTGIRQFLETTADIDVVAEAKDGRGAQMLLIQHQPDIAVLDLQLPDMSGVELARWLRNHYPAIGILVVTAYDEDPYVTAALNAGADGYMLKTASPAELIDAVRAVHTGRAALDLSIARKVMRLSGATSAEGPGYKPLTDREIEVLVLVAAGQTNKIIGRNLSISSRTVQSHLAGIYTKLDVNTRTEAVTKAVSLGWITLD
ncbi:MAG: response regulator transcription factor [Anaerolineae bacterium]|nr:response regulator transcription factor [Anaerolineae bacterium]MCO5191028.1 response regulator transcription factor [Anaerolineae bacterium]MCO5196047.1 response regulator transcription factor [Anaerolineae bacterium]MCO5199974.1 response regulator transcription factor [Anaerolineae bacterium]MCO5206491.1 response regulator transcription factor [Anaerolineae bacterium]